MTCHQEVVAARLPVAANHQDAGGEHLDARFMGVEALLGAPGFVQLDERIRIDGRRGLKCFEGVERAA